MNFRDATDAFLAYPRSVSTIARSMERSDASINAARYGKRKPPPGWEEAIATLALSEADRMRALALNIRRAVEAYPNGGNDGSEIVEPVGARSERGVGHEDSSAVAARQGRSTGKGVQHSDRLRHQPPDATAGEAARGDSYSSEALSDEQGTREDADQTDTTTAVAFTGNLGYEDGVWPEYSPTSPRPQPVTKESQIKKHRGK